MSMFDSQIKKLREKADILDGLEGMDNLVPMLREAADTIERLQELQGVASESRYTELFGTPERAARTWYTYGGSELNCPDCPMCKDWFGKTCELPEGLCAWNIDGDYSALAEWLRGDA